MNSHSEISKFRRENDIDFREQYKILVPSQEPKDNRYIDFINALDLGVAIVGQNSLKPIGADFVQEVGETLHEGGGSDRIGIKEKS